MFGLGRYSTAGPLGYTPKHRPIQAVVVKLGINTETPAGARLTFGMLVVYVSHRGTCNVVSEAHGISRQNGSLSPVVATNGGVVSNIIMETDTGEQIPIIALPVNKVKGVDQRCIDAGMDDYFSKPAQNNELSATVESSSVDRTSRAASLRLRLSSRGTIILGLVLLVLAVYATSLTGAFIYDDHRVVQDSPLLGHWNSSTLKTIFTRDYWAAYHTGSDGPQSESLYYRPVLHLYEMGVYSLAGKNVFIWHLFSVLLHALATVLVMLVLHRSLEAAGIAEKHRLFLSAFAAGIFAVHPVQGEAVAWVAAFANPLVAVFSLGSFYCYLRYRQSSHQWLLIVSSLLLGAALFTKEVAVTMVFVVIAYELFIFHREASWLGRIRKMLPAVLPLTVVTLAYLAVRFGVLRAVVGRETNMNFPEDVSLVPVDNLRTLPALLMAYLRLAASPFNHSMMYDFGHVRSFGFTSFWLPLGFLLVAASLLVYASRRRRELCFASFWMIVPLLPHLNSNVFPGEEILHDRYLYLPMVGIALLLAMVMLKATSFLQLSGKGLATISLLTLIALGLSTAAENMQWRNDGVLWTHAAAYAPNSRIVHITLGHLAESRGDYDVALEEYDAARRVNPDTIDALNNAAFVLARQGRWPEATMNFERIVSLTPNKAVAHFNLSIAYGAQQRFGEAERERRAAASLQSKTF